MEEQKFINKILKKYRDLSEPAKASIWFAICNAIQKGIALLSTPIFTRLLTTYEYGVYSVYQSWYSVIYLFTTMNLAAGVYNNGMIKWPDDRKRYASASLGLSTTIWGFWLLIFIMLQNFWLQIFSLPRELIFAMFIDALMNVALAYWSSSERFDFKYQTVVKVSIVMGILSPIIGIMAVYLSENNVTARIYSYVLVDTVVGMFFFVKIMRKGRTFFSWIYWKFAVTFNLPLIPYYLSQNILNQADRIMIADINGEDKAAIYSIAYTISMMFTIVVGAINSSFVPYTYKALKDDEYDGVKRNTTMILMGISIGTALVILFGPEVIRIFAAEEYFEARWVIPPVAEVVVFSYLYTVFCNVEFYYEKTKFAMIASLIAAVMNLGLNYFFINLFGYLAAAYTTLFCYILLAVMHYVMYRKICMEERITEDIYNMKYLMSISSCSIAIMFVFVFIYDRIIIRYSLIAMLLLFTIVNKNKIYMLCRNLKYE